jgi:hypothetical protein
MVLMDHRTPPDGEHEVLEREATSSRASRAVGAGILVLVLAFCGAVLVAPTLSSDPSLPPPPPQAFNLFTQVENACDDDAGSVVTTDVRGVPTAFATPDGPQRYWCVSRRYLTSVGLGPSEPLPRVTTIPAEYRWRWPSTAYGR